MASDWQELTNLTKGAPLVVERVRIGGTGTAIEGAFDLPPLARLTAEDQVFVMAFVRSHGSIKEMERAFGDQLPDRQEPAQPHRRAGFEFVIVEPAPESVGDGRRSEVLERLERGEISDVDEAIARMSPP